MPFYQLPNQLQADFNKPKVKPAGQIAIDHSNRLNDQCVFLYDGYENRDLTGLNSYSSDVGSGTPSETITLGGKSTTFNDNARRFTSNGMNDVDAYSVTLAVKARNVGAAWNFSSFFGKSSNFGTSTGWKLYRAGNISGAGQWRVEQGGNDATITTGFATDNAILDDQFNIISLVWDGTTSYLYINGQLNGSVAQGSKPVTTAGYFYIMGNTDFYASEGDVYYCHVSRRALSEAEVFSLHRNPYQILKPVTPAFFFLPIPATGNFTLTADTGAYTVTGTTNSLLLDALLGADTGSYSYTGTATDLTTGYSLQADTGSYTYTGTANALLVDLLLTSDTGTYSYSGTANTLAKGSTLTADAGSYAYSGTGVSLTFEAPGDFTLAANTGTYSVSGTNADLVAAFSLTSDTGTYSYAGTAATLSTGVTLQADTGSYTYTGTAADFSTTLALNAETGVYVYNGNNATLSASGQVWTVQTDSVTTWTTQTDSNTTWNIEG